MVFIPEINSNFNLKDCNIKGFINSINIKKGVKYVLIYTEQDYFLQYFTINMWSNPHLSELQDYIYSNDLKEGDIFAIKCKDNKVTFTHETNDNLSNEVLFVGFDSYEENIIQKYVKYYNKKHSSSLNHEEVIKRIILDSVTSDSDFEKYSQKRYL